jgi:hypothetical protein
MGKVAENTPLPHEFTPRTVRLPEVAVDENDAVIDAVLPDGVKPIPLYDHV